jgi:glycerophosphoryl diester phosphodiesterase
MQIFNQHPTIYAHRGAMADAPENTISAFKLAIEQGADGVELDVRLTADKEVVVIHDRFVDRLTDGKGQVGLLKLEELKRLDAGTKFNHRFRGEKIPALREVFENIGDQTRYDIELKSYFDPYGGLVKKVVQLVREFNLEERVLFTCYTPFPLIQIQRLVPESKAAMIFLKGKIGVVQRIAGGWWNSDIVVTAVEEVTQLTVTRIHGQNQKIIPFTANSTETIRNLVSWKVDGIITEKPALASQIVRDV